MKLNIYLVIQQGDTKFFLTTPQARKISWACCIR